MVRGEFRELEIVSCIELWRFSLESNALLGWSEDSSSRDSPLKRYRRWFVVVDGGQ